MMRKISIMVAFVFLFYLIPVVQIDTSAEDKDSMIVSVDGSGGAAVDSRDIAKGKITISNMTSEKYAVVKVNVKAAGLYRVDMNIDAKDVGNIVVEADSAKQWLPFQNGSSLLSKSLLLTAGETDMKIYGDGHGVPVIKSLGLTSLSTKYEAEAAMRTGYAVISDQNGASGGAVVKRIGGPHTNLGGVIFSVYAPVDGTYGVIVDYTQMGTDPFYMSTNKENEVEVLQTGTDSYGFSAKGKRYAEVKLNAGENKLKIYSKTEYTMDLDCITVFAPGRPFDGGQTNVSAKLKGNASIAKCYGSDNGCVVTGLGPNGSVEFKVSAGKTGTYLLKIWYASADYKSLDVYADDNLQDSIFCPITGEAYNIGTVDMRLNLSAGNHTLKFTNAISSAPDIEKIQLTKVDNQADQDSDVKGAEKFDNQIQKVGDQIERFDNQLVRVEYDMKGGKANVFFNNILRVKDMQSVVKVNDANTVVKSSDYLERSLQVTDVKDGFGNGKIYTVISEAPSMPKMLQSFSVYDQLPYVLVKVELSDTKGVSSNFMAPITATGEDCVKFDNRSDMRSLFVPYDNDAWVRYHADPVEGQHTSCWVSAVYDNTSRNAVVVGSIDHDTWKSGISTFGDGKNVNFLGAFGGLWSTEFTYDYLPHGSISGNTISSPRMFLGYFDDWRTGMETYGQANTKNVPSLNFDGGVPFGYNSWYAQQSSLNYKDSVDASDFIHQLGKSGFEDKGVSYINLDSYWDNLNDDQLKAFVNKCKANGQKAGIYWSHYVFWATDSSWGMGIDNYKWRDALIDDGYGGVVAISKDSGSLPTDPTSPAMQARVKLLMEKFVNCGFEFIKIDFLNYAALEGVYHDPNVTTGMQAYNRALEEFTKYIDTNKVLLSYSIAPLFPYQYGHARRVSCDAAGTTGDTEYMLNSLTYGWWTGSMYRFVDGDMIPVNKSTTEALTRYNSDIITGGLMLLSDKYSSRSIRNLTKQITSNKEVNDIVRMNKAFRPVEGNTENHANNLFTLNTNDEFYLAAFNYEGTVGKVLNIEMERIGLDKNVTYKVYDLWTKKSFNAKGSFKVDLAPAQSTIYKIVAAQ